MKILTLAMHFNLVSKTGKMRRHLIQASFYVLKIIISSMLETHSKNYDLYCLCSIFGQAELPLHLRLSVSWQARSVWIGYRDYFLESARVWDYIFARVGHF